MSKGSVDSAALRALSGFGPELAATFVSVASDIAVVIGPDGVVSNVAVGQSRFGASTAGWVGRPWADTVTSDTRNKIEQLLEEVADGGLSRRREVSIPSPGGESIPIAYSAIRLGEHGPVLAVGRDLRSIAAIQQRFVDAQQEIERDYWRQRQAETRYRMLFQVANDAVLLVDSTSLEVTEANDAALNLLGLPPPAKSARPFLDGFAAESRPAVEALLLSARSTGRPAEIRARLAAADDVVAISATPFKASSRGDATMLLLVRARRAERERSTPIDIRTFADFVERTPDAVVVTDAGGHVLSANPAFVALGAELGGSGDVRGRLIGETLGDRAGALVSLLADIRRTGVVGRRVISVDPAGAARGDIEVSAAVLAEGDQENIGMTLRRVSPDVQLQLFGRDLVQRIEHLAGQLGMVPLPQMLQMLMQQAERQIISTALAQARGDRREAAGLLGISVENLALRLKRIHPGHDDPARAAPA